MIWPASNAISILARSSATAHDLGEDAVHGVWVDERDLQPEQAPTRLRVDQLDALLGQIVERSADIGDLVGDVVHARPSLREELAHRGLGPERREQLDAIGADPERRRLDALFRDRLAVLEPSAEEPLVRSERLVEILDRDTQVVNPLRLHAADATDRLVGCDDSDCAYGFRGARLDVDVTDEGAELVLVERLVLEQRPRDPVEDGSVLLQQPPRLPLGVVRQPRLLLVAQPLRLLGE